MSKKTGRPLSFDRNEVLNKAMLAFWEHGYETTSLSELSEVMGLNTPSIYATFGDKKQLFIESVELYVGDLDSLKMSIMAAASAREAAYNMLRNSAISFTGKYTPRGCLLASSTASGSEASLEVKQVVLNYRKKIEGFLKIKIEDDVKNKILKKEALELNLAAFVISVIQGMSVLARDGATQKKLLEIGETSMRAWPISEV